MVIFTSLPNFDAELSDFTKLIDDAGKLGLMTMLHCEDRSINQIATERLVAKGQTAIKYYPASRPTLNEEVATQRCVAISELTGSPIDIVHVASERALKVIESAHARGVKAYIETRILYVHLTEKRFEAPDGNIYTGYPPLRTKQDKDYLWKGIEGGKISAKAGSGMLIPRHRWEAPAAAAAATASR